MLLLYFSHNLLTIHDISFYRYEFQMQYGSIGWSVGATLGYAQAAKDKRVISCIGDGSFQVIILGPCRGAITCYALLEFARSSCSFILFLLYIIVSHHTCIM